MSSYLITMQGAARDYCELGVYYECGVCGYGASVTLELGGDGTALFVSGGRSLRTLKSSLASLYLVRTIEGNLSISCGRCRSGKTVLTISQVKDGIFSSNENYEVPEGAD